MTKKRGIPELGLDFASFATSVEGTCKVSNLIEDIQDLEDRKALLKSTICSIPNVADNQ